jgi:Holliday junction resolvasome RuvABC DNA-binding subunit
MPLEKLVEIPGIGEKTAEKVLATAQEYLAAHPVEPAGPADLEFTPEMESGDGPEADTAAPDVAEGEPHAG